MQNTRTPNSDSFVVTTELNAEQARVVLDRAVRQRAALEITPLGDSTTSILLGEVSGEDDVDLLATGEAARVCSIAQTAGTSVNVWLTVHHRRYGFTTELSRVSSGGNTGSFRLTRPRRMFVAERRRSARRQLHQTAEVSLHADSPGGVWHGVALLLNLSVNGLACRLSAREADGLSKGRIVRAVFQIAGDGPTFDLPARVANVTACGTEKCVVVGVEFSTNTASQQQRDALHEALGESTAPAVGTRG